MEIFMDHPHNGAKVVYSAAEAAGWEAKGWKIRAETVEAGPEKDTEQAPEPEAPKKPGRKAKS